MLSDSSLLVKASPAGLSGVSLGTVYVYVSFKAASDSSSSQRHMAFPFPFFQISEALLILQFAIVIFPPEYYISNASTDFIK